MKFIIGKALKIEEWGSTKGHWWSPEAANNNEVSSP